MYAYGADVFRAELGSAWQQQLFKLDVTINWNSGSRRKEMINVWEAEVPCRHQLRAIGGSRKSFNISDFGYRL